jgi:hypothetical protein
MRSSWTAERLLGALVPILAVVAEGAWLTVAYVAVETAIDGELPLLGTLELAAAAGLAALAVRRRWLRPDDAPLRFFAALLVVGAIGWLWSAEARDPLLRGDLATAIGLHPGGWLLLVAAMRGVGRGVEIDDRALTRLVLVGVPSLALPWILGQLGSGALRAAFVEAAFIGSLTFVATGFMAAGLARLSEIGRETGVDWRRNRSWLGTVLGVLALVLGIGIPGALLLGLPIDAVARGLVGPVVSLIGYAFLALAFVAAIGSAALYEVLSRLGIVLPAPATADELNRLPQVREYTIDQLQGPLATIAILWLAVAVLAVVVIRTWIRRRIRGLAHGIREERRIVFPQRSFRLPTRALPLGPRRTSRSPTDAVSAYLAALDELQERRPVDARRPEETPHDHAARVGIGEIAALQADYALARYGGRALSPTEHRRALGRFARLRARLRRPALDSGT